MDKVGLCNMAIGHLGISKFIGDLDTEQSNEARVCRIFFDQALDRVLSEMPWSFAKSYADLQDIGSPPSRWQYRYRYPSNCLTVRAVTARGTDLTVDQYFNLASFQWLNRDSFEVIEDEDNGGLAICTNIPQAQLIFTRRIRNISLWPAFFRDAFSWSLAGDVAVPLTAQMNAVQICAQAYRSELLKAAAHCMNEGKEDLERESEFIAARY